MKHSFLTRGAALLLTVLILIGILPLAASEGEKPELPITTEPVTLTVYAGLDSNLTGIINDSSYTIYQSLMLKCTAVW